MIIVACIARNKTRTGRALTTPGILAAVLLRFSTAFADDGLADAKKTTYRNAPAHVTMETRATTGFDTHRTENTAVRLYQIAMIGDSRVTKTLRLKFGVGVQYTNVTYSNSNIDHSGIGINLTALGNPTPYLTLRPEFKVFERGVNALYFYEELEGSITAHAKLARASIDFLGKNIDLTDSISKYIAVASYRTFIHTIGLKYHHQIPLRKLMDRRWLSWIGDNVDPTGEGIIISPYIAYVRLYFDLDAVYTPEGKRFIKSVSSASANSQTVTKGKFNWDKDAGYFALSVDIPVLHGTHLRFLGSYLPIKGGSIYQAGGGIMVTLP